MNFQYVGLIKLPQNFLFFTFILESFRVNGFASIYFVVPINIKSEIYGSTLDYQYGYNKGYMLITKKNIHLFVIRVENLKECFCDVIPEIFSIEDQVDLHQYNIREIRFYFGEYALINHHFQVPQDLCENIYATQYAKYFYSEKEHKNFIAKRAA